MARTPKRKRKPPAKRKKKKKGRPSTTRSTAGPGFDFEDQVAAWLLLKALTGQPLPVVDGIGTRLQMQTEALGWDIDDILVTTVADGPVGLRHLAVSCKSNVQVTASSLPADFVARCWRQWTKADPNPLQRGKDCLTLVTRGRNNAFMATWTEFKTAAPGRDVALALGRMRATAKHRAMFTSVKAPAKNAGIIVSDPEVVAMVETMAVVPLDFHIATSEDERQAIRQSRSLIADGSLAEGKRLWTELVAQARTTRLGSGTLDIADLWRRLRREFVLKDHPNYEGSWQKLKALTDDHKATIETELTPGLTLDRQDEITKLVERMATDTVVVIFGESGSGKSALVKATLDERFQDAVQVWFGPDNLDVALNESTRANIGIGQPLIEVLDATARAENFVVIDAAERLSRNCALKAKALIEDLKERNAAGAKPAWRVLIVGQTEAWVRGTLQELAGSASPKTFEVEGLPAAIVRDVLHTVPDLGWLATHSDAVSALTNLRTLAWVAQAAARFQGRQDGTLSLTAIANRLWSHWTDDRPSVQRLLVRLAEREAAFEHSFAISQLESGDVAALDNLPIACPLRRDEASGRIQFRHDLAADWARFQRLKEIAEETTQWARFASNPFWHSALRMLGQLLLRRQVESRTAWDIAFEIVERDRDTTPLADDILLDALFLDPNADSFLDARADMLLADGGMRLTRLVNRFEHVASVPGTNVNMEDRFRDLSLYIEAHFRTPIFGRWPAMARFLAKHRDHIAKMTSPAIASLCSRWLASAPLVLRGGAVMPFRREFAELALASAREMQLGHAKGIMYLGDFEARIYEAAFAGAPDLPADVSEWALEMAQRRPYRADIIEQVRAHRAEQRAEHKRRMETDPVYRERHERRHSIATPFLSRTKLPPWPLGPKRRVERGFRDAVMRTAGFQALMRTNPAVAGEVLVASIIEDDPEEDFSSSRGPDHELGIKFDNESYPTAPWKSPFYAFLQINPDAALRYLHQLINFSTDRWAHALRRRGHTAPETLSLRLTDGTPREYAGNYWVFTWSHQNSAFIGQLHCALAALERWLCDLIDKGIDVAVHVDALLRTTNSVAVLGVLVNVGKYHDTLFKGTLRAFLSVQQLYTWDWRRAEENAYWFDAMTWARSGEVVFEMARNWVGAPYRERRLRWIVPKLFLADRKLGEFLVAASGEWVSPTTDKEALEFRILVADLDYRNYSSAVDPETGKEAVSFAHPPELAAAIAAFQQENSRAIQALSFPDRCRTLLTKTRTLNPQEAQAVASLMAALDGDEEVDLHEEIVRVSRVAAAAALLLRAPDWLTGNAEVQQRAQAIIDATVADISDETMPGGPPIPTGYFEFAAYFAVQRWIAEPSKESDERVLRLLTSGDRDAVQVLCWFAYRNRDALGPRWWRLMHVALLWSGLAMLAPRFGDEDVYGARWLRWRRWLRRLNLASGNTTAKSIDPLAVAQRAEQLEIKLWQRRYAQDGRRFAIGRGRRLSGSLDTHFLQNAFAWLLRDQSSSALAPDERDTHRRLVLAFWAHQAWWLSGSGEKEDDDYQPMPEFGYAILDELARLTIESPAADTPALWRPIFALGPKGHYAIGHFLTAWFNQLTESTVATEYAQRWRPMIQFIVLTDEWAKDGRWYYRQQLERHVLGFGMSGYLGRLPAHDALVGSIRDLIEVWARKRLTGDEDNLAGLCGFLGTGPGKPLRIAGLQWISGAIRADAEVGKWFRDRTSNAFMEFLDVLVSEHAGELAHDEKPRQALLDLIAHAVSRRLTAALTLQERFRRLF
jgi:hypothetical protein